MSLPLKFYLQAKLPNVDEGFDHEAAAQQLQALLKSGAYTVARVLRLMTFAWLIVGSALTLESSTCRMTSPSLFTLSLVLVVLFIVMISMFFLYACAYFFVLVVVRTLHRLRLLGLARQTQTTTAMGGRSGGRVGVPEDVLLAMPKIVFASQQASLPNENYTCAVCLGDFEQGEEVRVLPCLHSFHCKCIDPWLLGRNSCPLCQRPLIFDSTAPASPSPNPSPTAASLPLPLPLPQAPVTATSPIPLPLPPLTTSSSQVSIGITSNPSPPPPPSPQHHTASAGPGQGPGCTLAPAADDAVISADVILFIDPDPNPAPPGRDMDSQPRTALVVGTSSPSPPSPHLT
eukprot:CAMPEP_0184671214 /NCGR_PEP_ID=MMETSP0308-20130426/85366_1 /TAXON_ID=38269 /ORGANISM="Gloeochaete witrockiana, Strain SAG 46.84" /LENGTH=344 /DNA_ID=CAMNT_0027118297 /DNA_START=145 /DNA_END=1179 /DNA_ORIENTATION=-